MELFSLGLHLKLSTHTQRINMAQEAFTELITRFCTMVNIDSAGAIMHGSAVEVDGMQCFLKYREYPSYERVLIYCDCGPLPDSRSGDACKKLLEANLYIFSTEPDPMQHYGYFSIAPDSGHVFLGESHALADLTPEALKNHIAALVDMAQRWRQDYFLSVNGSSDLSEQLPSPGFGSYIYPPRILYPPWSINSHASSTMLNRQFDERRKTM